MNTTKDYTFLSNEVEKVKKQIKNTKEDLQKLQSELSTIETNGENALNILHQQEISILLMTRNFHLKKLYKLGEANEHFLVREKIRQEKIARQSELTENKEKYASLLQEKEKEKESLIILKRVLRKEQESVKTALVSVYFKILNAGVDLREEGLRWVIKCL